MTLLTDHLSLISGAPDGIKKLRKLILELAVRGKILQGDEYGKIDTWRQFKLPEVTTYRIGKTPPSKDPRYWSSDGVPWVSISDMRHGVLITETVRKVAREHLQTTFKYPPVPAGSLLMSFKLTIGKVSILGVDAYHNEAIISMQPNAGVCRDYLMRVLPAIALNGQSKDALMGSTLNSSTLAQLVVPLPSLDEQKAIVAKVDELMSLCDTLESQQANAESAHAQLVQALLDSLTQASDADDFAASWQRLSEHFDTLFTTEASIDALKQTVLQLAVMGKLVPQDPADEPARDILRRQDIGSEPHHLIGWAEAPLGEFGKVLGGATPSKSNPEFWSGAIPWVTPKDMKRPVIDGAQDHVSAEAVAQSSLKMVPSNSLLMVVRGMILAHSFPVAITSREVTINQDMKALVVPENVANYLLMWLQASKREMVELVDRSTHGTCKLVSHKLWSKVVSLPPSAEQRRIVAKVDQLMAICDQVKDRIRQARDLNQQLASTLVERAVA